MLLWLKLICALQFCIEVMYADNDEDEEYLDYDSDSDCSSVSYCSSESDYSSDSDYEEK